MPDPSPGTPKKPVKIALPTGTRDFYPREMLVRRYITDAWRRTALRHGFDEIDGPTFESAELYKVKSGEGILNEMFGVFSGKAEGGRRKAEDAGASSAPAEIEPVFDYRNPPFGLRPEFTPTLARMYAARAKQLPQPTKWFCVSNFFRAERPQRGRLREFWQWNCDVIGGESSDLGDVDATACCLGVLAEVGLGPTVVNLKISHRKIYELLFDRLGIKNNRDELLAAVDQRAKMDKHEFLSVIARLSGSADVGALFLSAIEGANPTQYRLAESELTSTGKSELVERAKALAAADLNSPIALESKTELLRLGFLLRDCGFGGWFDVDPELVRGLAYYTGTVFEVIAEGERAVAGGGRYDNLIELFGGPPTPACGFGMGDAVLGNLLEDRKLIPEGREMLEALSRPMPLRPDVFVIASPNEGCEELIVPTVARLRRGEESEKYRQGECKPWSTERYSVPPLHARRSYKATKNVGKLLADAGACHARFAAIIESPEKSTLKYMDTGEQISDVPLDQLARRVAGTL